MTQQYFAVSYGFFFAAVLALSCFLDAFFFGKWASSVSSTSVAFGCIRKHVDFWALFSCLYQIRWLLCLGSGSLSLGGVFFKGQTFGIWKAGSLPSTPTPSVLKRPLRRVTGGGGGVCGPPEAVDRGERRGGGVPPPPSCDAGGGWWVGRPHGVCVGRLSCLRAVNEKPRTGKCRASVCCTRSLNGHPCPTSNLCSARMSSNVS